MFAEFSPISTQEWENVIQKDLKGADYAKKLLWKTLDGFTVKPYYREEDAEKIPNLEENQHIIRKNRNNNDWEIVSKSHNDETLFVIDTSLFHDSGATITQTLGISLAWAKMHLSQLTGMGVSIDEILPKIRVNLSVDSNYFFEIAKIRAARLLYHRLLTEYHTENTKIHITAVTSSWNKTIYDAYNNVLRTTTEAMSAVIGGVDALKIGSFDEFFKAKNEFSSRIAENQHHILKEESHLDEVIDPAAGSYYIESITEEIAKQAWAFFQEIEEKGGFQTCIENNFLCEKIGEIAVQKLKDVASRKKSILGVNIFPNVSERRDDICLSDKVRAAEQIEKIRLKTEKYVADGNKRPLVFLLTFGDLTMRRARAGFALNFFGCAGFDIQDNNGFASIEEGLAAANKAQADIVVFCSSDNEYVELIDSQLDIDNNYKALFVLAGNPGENEKNYRNAGIETFIHVKSNLVETLDGLL
ncbi:MAG: methylmalonyl-CoA mutase family protein [Bacteroidales bacterium]|jgi:methylmalonyl-CoA mutase|nr:methylmalonyl-CoA mutase family protein [Bacteroidales bacterium]